MVLEPAEGVSGLISALILATWTSWTSWTSSQLERTLPYDSVGQVVWPSRLLVQVGHVGHIVQVGHVGHIYIYISLLLGIGPGALPWPIFGILAA